MTALAVPAAGRPAVDPWRAMWILAGSLALFLFLRDFAALRSDGSIAGGARWGRDFANVWTSGRLVLEGKLSLVYDVEAYRAYQTALFGGGIEGHNYSYPPVSLLYTWLFALLPYPAALGAWIAGTGALFAAAARPYLRGAGLPAWAALLAPASIVNVWAGHYGFLIGALWLGAWHWLPRRPALAGVLIGLMLVKPHLAVLAPFVLAWRREWTAIAAAAATALLLVALSSAAFGFDLWVTYVTQTARVQAAMVDDTGAFFITMMPTLVPSLALVGVPTALATGLQAVAGLAALGLLLWKLPKDSREAGLAASTATFLVLPYAFSYDMTVVGLAALLLFRRALDEARRPIYLFLAFCAALLPMLVFYLNAFRLPVAPALLAFQLAAALALRPPARE